MNSEASNHMAFQKATFDTYDIKDTLHVPKLQENLLSVSILLLNGLKVQFNPYECIVRGPNGEVDCNRIM
jgi:hypothetical protein